MPPTRGADGRDLALRQPGREAGAAMAARLRPSRYGQFEFDICHMMPRIAGAAAAAAARRRLSIGLAATTRLPPLPQQQAGARHAASIRRRITRPPLCFTRLARMMARREGDKRRRRVSRLR